MPYTPVSTIERQRQLANMLRNTPMRTDGRPAKTDVFTGLAHLLRQYDAGKKGRQVDEMEAGNKEAMSSDMARLLEAGSKTDDIQYEPNDGLASDMTTTTMSIEDLLRNKVLQTPEAQKFALEQQFGQLAEQRKFGQERSIQEMKNSAGGNNMTGAMQVFFGITGKTRAENPEEEDLLYRIHRSIQAKDMGGEYKETGIPSYITNRLANYQRPVAENQPAPDQPAPTNQPLPTQPQPGANQVMPGGQTYPKSIPPEKDPGHLAKVKGAEVMMERFVNKDMPAARSELDKWRSLDRAEGLISKTTEGVRSGTFADFRQGFGNLINTLGITYDADPTANTHSFMVESGRRTLAIIGSGALGTGTGISDADREFAQKVAAGEITASEESMRQTLALEKKIAQVVIERYNARAQEYQPDARYNLMLDTPWGEGEDEVEKILREAGL